ncbi:MAG: TonB-dependent receptor [Gemmatimonadetes bacterium]|nr:TonB-dependent receptor [Gemmatimonadota bacterium]
MLKRYAWIVFAAAWAVALPTAAYAQASVTGLVRDSSGGVLPGVTVEAASPALIEKVRAVVTDSSGRYRIVDLPPGAYSVTFTLPGFAIVRREGVELSGNFSATVNADLRVGSIEETITVTGETPVVDLQSAGQRSTMDKDVITAIPSARLYHSIVALVPGVVTSGTQDVGGVDGPVFKLFTIHGGRGNEGQITVDGMSVGAALNGAGVSYYVSDIGNSAEVAINLSAGETDRGGPVMNVVPRTGGNTYSGTFFATGASGGMQSSNFDQAIKDAGLRSPNELDQIWDVNGALGGPLVRDRFWFYWTGRHQGNRKFVTGMFNNLNAGDPTKWTYEPGDRARDGGTWKTSSLRLTLQATARNKFNIFWDEQSVCSAGCNELGGTATTSPEAHQPTEAYPSRVQQVTWTSPTTNRLLLEAGYGNYLARWGGQERPANNRDLIPVLEQGGFIPNLSYRSQLSWSRHWNGTHNWRASASYVTGAHSLKVGYVGQFLVLETTNFRQNQRLRYRFNNGTPNQLTMYGDHAATTINHTKAAGIYVQEQWTRHRLTLQGGLRYDRAWSDFPQMQVGPELYIPNAFTIPAASGVEGFNDITMRAAGTYDLFGTGKTALKVNVGKYLEAAQNSVRYTATNARNRVVTSTTRNWTDANGNFVPDCNLLNPAAQDTRASGGDSCGAWSDQLFGSQLPETNYDPAIISGWNVRPNDWQFGVGVQHEVVPRVSVEVSYNRRWFGNFDVTDNLAVGPGDFDTFSITAPLDPRLEDGGGQVIGNLYNIKPAKFGVADNLVTAASKYGDRTEYWHGFDVNVNARLQSLTVQGGTSTGRRVSDDCEIRAALPETAALNPYCRVVENFRSQFKGLASYLFPAIDVQVSATWQSIPGNSLAGNWVVANALIQPSLGRPLAGGAANATINVARPQTVFGERINQVDFRVAKIFRFSGRRAQVSVDLYNLTNSNAIEGYVQTFGSRWLTPSSVLSARFVKISGQIDF